MATIRERAYRYAYREAVDGRGVEALAHGRYGEEIGDRVLARLKAIGPRFEELIADQGIALRLEAFAEFVRKMGLANGDPWDARTKFSEKLGLTYTYRGLALNEQAHQMILEKGMLPRQFQYRSNEEDLLACATKNIRESLAWHVGPIRDGDSILSLTNHREIAEGMAAKECLFEDNEVYVYRVKVPELDVFHASDNPSVLPPFAPPHPKVTLHRGEVRNVKCISDLEIESFVQFGIEPSEIDGWTKAAPAEAPRVRYVNERHLQVGGPEPLECVGSGDRRISGHNFVYRVDRVPGSKSNDLIVFFTGMGSNERAFVDELAPGLLKAWADENEMRPEEERKDFPAVATISIDPNVTGLPMLDLKSNDGDGKLHAFCRDLLPEIEAQLPFPAAKRHFLGASLGGFNVLQVLFNRKELVDSVAVLSPMIPVDPLRPEAQDEIVGLAEGMIRVACNAQYETSEEWDQADPLQVAGRQLAPTSPPLFVSANTDDGYGFFDPTKRFVETARAKNAPVEAHWIAGQHLESLPFASLAAFLRRHCSWLNSARSPKTDDGE